MSDFVIDGNGVLTEYRGAGGEVVIPDGVRIIGESAFRNCESISSVIICGSVKIIEYAAFACCKDLEKAVIFDGVTHICDFAFYECKKLKSVAFGKTLISVGDEAFGECGNIDRIYYSGSEEEYDAIAIGVDNYHLMFNDIYCNVVPNGDFVIGDGEYLVRYDGENEKSLTLPACIKELAPGVFSGCKELVYIDVEPENEYFSSINGDLYSKDGKTFICRARKKFELTVRLPEQITKIEKFSFFRVLGMIQVIVPKNVEIIGDSAFYGDTALVIVELPASIKYIGSEAFQQTHLKRIYYRGNENDWKNVKIADANGVFNKATVYYYREDKPTDEGNYWHYDGEKGVVWEK